MQWLAHLLFISVDHTTLLILCMLDVGGSDVEMQQKVVHLLVVTRAWRGCTQIEMLVEEYVDTVPKGQS